MKSFKKLSIILASMLLVVVALTGCYNLNGIGASGGGKMAVTELNGAAVERSATMALNVDATEVPEEWVDCIDAEGFMNFNDIEKEDGLDFRLDVTKIYYMPGLASYDAIYFYGVSPAKTNSLGEDLYIVVYAQVVEEEKEYTVNIKVFDEDVNPLNTPAPLMSYTGTLTGHIKLETY